MLIVLVLELVHNIVFVLIVNVRATATTAATTAAAPKAIGRFQVKFNSNDKYSTATTTTTINFSKSINECQ
jgi:hypothetical protein